MPKKESQPGLDFRSKKEIKESIWRKRAANEPLDEKEIALVEEEGDDSDAYRGSGWGGRG